ncbi:hypothetical protein Tco_1537381, partial [Tanacetum coccineum]
KERVKKLERRNKSRTSGLKRLKKVGRTARIESSEDEGLGAQEDASKHGRKIVNPNADAEVTLVDESQERNDDNIMFDARVLDDQEVEVEKVVSTAKVTTVSATTTTIDELTLAQTLIKIKAAKPKAVTIAATITTIAVTRPKARGAEDKGKEKNAKLEEEERLARQKEEDANIAEWDNVQAMIDADYELAARLQAQEQEELTVEEKSKLQLKNKSFDEVQKAFDKTMGRIDSFIYMDSEVVKGEQERIKKQKIDDDQKEAEMKKHMEIIVDEEEIAVDVLPLATKPLIINIDREDLETLWKLVKAKHKNTRPEEAYERVLWGDMKVMFEPDIESN